MSPLLVMAVAPAIALMYFFWLKDKYEPEPRNKIVFVMFLGGLTVIPAIILEVLGEKLVSIPEEGVPPLIALFIHTFVVIAVSEELGKFLVVRLTLYRDPEFDEPMDGIVYCVAASLGFALVENVFYVVTGGAGVAILRALLAVPAHALFGVAMGYFVGQARFANNKSVELQLQFIGFASAVAMHGAYDFVLFSARPLLMLCVFPMVGIFWFIGLRLIKFHVEVSPHRNKSVAPAGFTAPAAPPTSHCPLCHNAMLPGAVFCIHCGPQAAPAGCPNCQAPLHPGALFCGHCGQKVNAS